MAAARNLFTRLSIPPWKPENAMSTETAKRSLKRYRTETVTPAVMSLSGTPPNPPLPWAWIVLNADTAFPAPGFDSWWQLRVTGQTYPTTVCPWCNPTTALTANHLRVSCPPFAMRCWTVGVRPEEAFSYPPDDSWFVAILHIFGEIANTRDSK